MEELGQQEQDRSSSAPISTLPLHAGEDAPSHDNGIDKAESPKTESIVSPNPSVRNASRSQTPVVSNSSNTYTAPEQTYYYGGYGDGSVNWGDGSNYVHPNNLQIMPPSLYNDNSSLLYHPAYAYDSYGQYSPLVSPLSPIMIDGQLYAPHQFPFSPSFYSQPDLATPASSSNQEGYNENMFPGYYLHYPVSQTTPVGILGPYEQTQYHKESKGRDQNRNSVNLTNESQGDRNRGPRASKPKDSGAVDHQSNGIYNRPDFETTYEKAKFFVIKSFSEDNVHRSIKYGVWASTPLGNRKLDAAYKEATEAGPNCRIFLFFSVNASGQFCGVAEMIGPIDFENDAEYWQQDRWSGQFPVKWHIIKDIPNSRFRHILLENNDNKPVTHSRDSQEVNFEEGIAMLKIFKEHEADTSILDDFCFYDEREKSFQEKRAKDKDKEQVSVAKSSVDDASVNQLSDKIADSLQLEKLKEVVE